MTRRREVIPLEAFMDAETSKNRTLCPRCGAHYVLDGYVGDSLGFCPTCYMRIKAQAIREDECFIAAKREYDRLRQERRRIRQKIKEEHVCL